MQKKQIKIMGFQAEYSKLKLFYETNGEYCRYIVEKNRKYIYKTKYFESAKKYFVSLIYEDINQLNIDL